MSQAYEASVRRVELVRAADEIMNILGDDDGEHRHEILSILKAIAPVPNLEKNGARHVKTDERAELIRLFVREVENLLDGERFDLINHLVGQYEFSARTFGPGARTKGVLDHIRKELAEIEKSPADLFEWIDVVILAFDGALRAGHSPVDIVAALAAKQRRNEARTWPDWRSADPDKAIEHVRAEDA